MMACVCMEKDLWWWGNACLHMCLRTSHLPNVTGLRVKVASKCLPSRNYLRQHETQHGGRTRSNSKSMVSMEDAALSMAQEVACG